MAYRDTRCRAKVIVTPRGKELSFSVVGTRVANVQFLTRPVLTPTGDCGVEVRDVCEDEKCS